MSTPATGARPTRSQAMPIGTYMQATRLNMPRSGRIIVSGGARLQNWSGELSIPRGDTRDHAACMAPSGVSPSSRILTTTNRANRHHETSHQISPAGCIHGIRGHPLNLALGRIRGPGAGRGTAHELPRARGTTTPAGQGRGERGITDQARRLPRGHRRRGRQSARPVPRLRRVRRLGVADPPRERRVAGRLQRGLLARLRADAAELLAEDARGVSQAGPAGGRRRAHRRTGDDHALQG